MTDGSGERIRRLVEAARAQRLAVGSSRGTTGPLGELYACALLNLSPASGGMRGYDATDADGRRVQIKSRAPESGEHVNPVGTVGRITNWDFDYALLVLLDGTYCVEAIWRAQREDLERLQARVRNPARGISVRDFIRAAERANVTASTAGITDQEVGRGNAPTVTLDAVLRSIGPRRAHPIRDTETGKEYGSKYQAGKDLYWLVGGDVKDLHVWFKIARKFPSRFQTKNADDNWVALDDPSAPVGTTRPDS
jgi:hypothetical protein